MTEQFPNEPVSGDPNHEGETPQTPVEPTTSWWQTVLPLAIIGSALLALLFVTLLVVSGPILVPRSTPTSGEPISDRQIMNIPPPAPSDPGDESPVPADPSFTVDTAKHAELRAAEAQAIRSAKLNRFTTIRDQTNEHLDNLATEMASWSNLRNELLDGDGGRHIASDEAYMERFLPVYEKEHVTQPQYESFQHRLVSLSQPIEQSEQDTKYLPSEDLFGELQTLQDEVSAALSTLASTRKDAEAIQRFAASRPASDQTLRAALEDYRDQQQEDRLERIAARRREAEEETTARLAEEEAKREELRRQVELAGIEREKAALADERLQLETESEAEAERRRAAQQHAKLVREFEAEYPRFQSRLVVFTSKGPKQPVPFSPWKDTGKMEPVSLSAMKRAGLLDDSQDGRIWINRGAAALSGRDPGAFPNLSTGGPTASTRIREIQQFLLKYGEVMVEKELLAP